MVDDDRELCAMLAEFLEPEGFDLTLCHDGASGLQAARGADGEYSLLILDVMLPQLNGVELLRRLRAEKSTLPVLMLTAKGDDIDRIVGLEMGADDYLAKPFNPRELAARLKAILRRSSPASTPATLRERLHRGEIEVDVGARAARCAGRSLDLTTAEFDVLLALLRAAGQVVSREQLAKEVFERKLLRLDRTIDMHISNLRKKLGTDADGNERIVTVRGAGYLLAVRQ